ncbi:dUTPase domain-containing protein [Trichonephila clavata]|uniref:Deoxyuridine 5'-triphosphate nucleotidohydrolase n=1 Tax=Trichonephila clavata TaxID=2740835 RepID=A0A8X6FVN4_TRICU|nr:dUTPase domain-containing protein [Trichonephila clavata]
MESTFGFGNCIGILNLTISNRYTFGEESFKIGGMCHEMILFKESALTPCVELDIEYPIDNISDVPSITYPEESFIGCIPNCDEKPDTDEEPSFEFARKHFSAITPIKRDTGSVGYDLFKPFSFTIHPNETLKIDTGIILQLKGEGFYPHIFDKSSVSTNMKIVKRAGVIDVNYRGSIIVALRNENTETVHFKKGDPIAQLIFLPFFSPNLVEVPLETININTERGKRGFGGTTNI